MYTRKTAITLCSTLLFSLLSTHGWSTVDQAISVDGSPGPEITRPQAQAEVLQLKHSAAALPRISLKELSSTEAQSLKARKSLPRQIGISRNAPPLATTADTDQMLRWQPLPEGGYAAGIIINSPGALALRVGMTVESLPENGEFRFFSMQEETAEDIELISAREILALLQANREADPNDPDGKIFWSPTVAGDSLGIEIYLPEGENPLSVRIAFPLVSHIYDLPFGVNATQYSTQRYGDSNPCQNDATCASNWSNLRRSVAKMQFSTSQGTYACTGSLLNDTDKTTWKPYFLTANHCISSQAVASSLETHWFWESASCNSSTLSPYYTRITGGAALLHTQGMSSGAPTSNSMDTTLLRLNSAPPSGVYFAGWTTAAPPEYASNITGIHHPEADWKKISYGWFGEEYACYFVDNYFYCDKKSGNFYGVLWHDGGTEPGSSGSALYHDNDHVIGTLTGSDGICAYSYSAYSSFRAAYKAGNYGKWLTPKPEPKRMMLSPIYLLLNEK